MTVTDPQAPGDQRATWEMFAPPLDPPVDGGLPRCVALAIVDAWWDCDPYLAAALLWESYAASLPPQALVSQVSTGVQSVSYSSPGGAFGQAMARAAWFRSMAGTLASVPLDLAPLPGHAFDGTSWWEVYPVDD